MQYEAHHLQCEGSVGREFWLLATIFGKLEELIWRNSSHGGRFGRMSNGKFRGPILTLYM